MGKFFDIFINSFCYRKKYHLAQMYMTEKVLRHTMPEIEVEGEDYKVVVVKGGRRTVWVETPNGVEEEEQQ